MKSNSVELLIKAAVPCDPAVYGRTIYYASQIRGEADVLLLAEKYPNVPVVVETESESDPAAESTEGAVSSEEAEEEAKKDS